MSFGLENHVTIVGGGLSFSGWESVNISLAKEATAGTFQVETSDKELVLSALEGLFVQLPVIVLVNGSLVLTGNIEKTEISFDAESHSISISGRSKTGDLIDCSEDHETGEFEDKDCVKIAKDLCSPYGIDVETNAEDLPKLSRFHLEDGEPVHRAIHRVCRQSACSATFLPNGKLQIAQAAGTAAAGSLIEGVNIKRGRATFDETKRFQEITVKCQSNGTNERYGKAASDIFCKVKDPEVKRKRNLVINMDTDGDLDLCKKRAFSEAARRTGKAKSVSIQTTGWQSPEGIVWLPNTVAFVQSKMLRCTEPMLITSVTFTKGAEEGSSAEISLEPPEAHTPEPQGEKPSSSKAPKRSRPKPTTKQSTTKPGEGAFTRTFGNNVQVVETGP